MSAGLSLDALFNVIPAHYMDEIFSQRHCDEPKAKKQSSFSNAV